MKEECKFIGREILDIIEDVDKIEDRLIFGVHWKVSIGHINQQLDTVMGDTRDLLEYHLVGDGHYRKVEEAVGRLKAQLPTTGRIELETLPTDRLGVILTAVDGVKGALLDTLLESVAECACEK